MIGVWQTGITYLTGDELLLFERAYRTRYSGLTRMQTGSPMAPKLATARSPNLRVKEIDHGRETPILRPGT